MRGRRRESGQVMVLVAFALIALIGSVALVLLAGSIEWQRNQLQQLADQAALDSALKIGVGCDAASATTVITRADTFVTAQRSSPTGLVISGAGCAGGYRGTNSFAGGLSETINYPYRAHQQQVEVILTLTLPISFGSQLGQSNTTVIRRAVAQQLAGSTTALTATSLSCAGGQINVSGSVATQNAVTFVGTCALYAHMRFDATSGTYSDLGNVSVATAGQAWVNAGGSCTPGGTSGSTKAICSDGSEVSGQVPIACGTAGGTAFLSAGDAAVNPNPCAAGKAVQPAPSVSTALPPEPNTDAAAIATLQGNGGAACSAAGVYTTAVKSGAITFGAGLPATPSPIKDASGFYHLKPSCYSNLNLSSVAGGAIARVQSGPEVGPVKKDLILTLPAASTAGNLLVAVLRSDTNPSQKPFTPPGAGWLQASDAYQLGASHTAIWYYPNNPGALNNLDFGIAPASLDAVGQLTEWSGVDKAAPLDQAGTLLVSTNQTTVTLSTTGATTQANELVITGVGPITQAQTITQGAGWNSLVNDGAHGFSSEYRTDLAAGVASETVKSSVTATWSGVIATFKPAGASTGAVLDPGFYYFNGAGLGSGGGICLGGATLLARDVTLEFVNSTGFSTGTCAVGGGASCTGTCQFGSPPCSLQACPPNTAADSPNNLTWFAAPCAAAPPGDSASCLGASSWCPTGDRSCWNLLIWTPATNTGQIAIKGAVARHWLLGSIFWPNTRTCTDTVNGTSQILGTLQCGTVSMSAAAGAGTAIGGDYGISTALVEAVLVE